MDRRTLIGIVAGSLLVGQGAARTVDGPIGYFSFRTGPNEFEQSFLRGLRERGWSEPQNLVIDFRWAAFDQKRVPVMVAELLALQPALMVLADGTGALAMIGR